MSQDSLSHSRRLDDWNKRMTTFPENVARVANYMKSRLKIIKLGKQDGSLDENGFAIDKTPDDDYEMRDSATNGNTPYCKLLKFRYTTPRSRRGPAEVAALGRQYWFYPTMSNRMKQAIGEGARLQSYFSRSRMREAPYFLEIYGLLYESPVEGPKFFYVMHEQLPDSSMAHKLWNFEVTPRQITEWMLDLAKALEWLNLSGVAHRFVRPENVLLADEKRIRLAGFDVACSFYHPATRQYTLQPMGLPEEIPRQLWDHLPPECFTGEYDPKMVDSWSLGTLLTLLLTASHPFDMKNPGAMIQQWKQSKERATLPLVSPDDPMRSLLDDIFQMADKRMPTYDLIKDKRLNTRTGQAWTPSYYRIDLVSLLSNYT